MTTEAGAPADRLDPSTLCGVHSLGIREAVMRVRPDGSLMSYFSGSPFVVIPAKQLREVHDAFTQLHAEVAELREIAAHVDTEADDLHALAVRRWREIERLRARVENMACEITALLDEWPSEAGGPPDTHEYDAYMAEPEESAA